MDTVLLWNQESSTDLVLVQSAWTHYAGKEALPDDSRFFKSQYNFLASFFSFILPPDMYFYRICSILVAIFCLLSSKSLSIVSTDDSFLLCSRVLQDDDERSLLKEMDKFLGFYF